MYRPTVCEALFSAGSDDGMKAWLNGRLMVATNVTRSAKPGDEQVAIELRAGRNETLLKIMQGDDGWGFYAEVLDAESRLMSDVYYAPRRPE